MLGVQQTIQLRVQRIIQPIGNTATSHPVEYSATQQVTMFSYIINLPIESSIIYNIDPRISACLNCWLNFLFLKCVMNSMFSRFL